MTDQEAKNKGFANPYPQPPPPTFQGVAASYPPPPQPYDASAVGGFPQPVPPPATAYPPHPHQPPSQQYPPPVPGYAMEEGRPPAREDRLPCCGIGLGWILFIIGFIFGAIPWYIGTLLFLCRRHKMDYREKPGYIACAIAAVFATIIIIVGASTGTIYG